jgi:hypothetical protein
MKKLDVGHAVWIRVPKLTYVPVVPGRLSAELGAGARKRSAVVPFAWIVRGVVGAENPVRVYTGVPKTRRTFVVVKDGPTVARYCPMVK